ncbi:MAG: EAL domain-containing protein [Pseudomonadota bacterium]|nr:EAL domain-containing protein [Pseudomonadota bacterium]
MAHRTAKRSDLVCRMALTLAQAPTEGLSRAFDQVIGEITTHFLADRGFLLVLDDATQTVSVTHETRSEGIASLVERLRNRPWDEFTRLWRALEAQTIVSTEDPDGFASETANGLPDDPKTSHTLVRVGIVLEGKLAAVLGLDYPGETRAPGEEARAALESLAAVLGASLHRQILASRNEHFENSLYRYSGQFPGVIFQFRMYADGRVCFPFISRKVEDMFGLPVETLRPDARALLDLIADDDKAAFFKQVQLSRRDMSPFETDFRAIKKDGSVAWIEARSVPAMLADQSTVWHGYFYDVTDRKRSETEIEQLAFYDPLTALPNRRLLRDRLAQALSGSNRDSEHGALVFIDLDNFKDINDTAGHPVGDILLVQVARRLEGVVREWDTVARLGGDEFVLILKGFSEDPADAATKVEKVCEKVRDVLSQPYRLEGCEYTGSASMGVTLFFNHDTSLEELLSQADMAMFRAKADGRDRIRFYDSMMQKKVAERLAMESDLRAAIRKDQLDVYYQLLVDRDGVPEGAEALLRWKRPGKGMVSPAEFIPLAEETGLIEPLGYWVMERVMAQVARWQKMGEPYARLQVSINVSARQFHLASFCTTVMGLLRKTGASPRRLKIEITESALAYDLELVEQTLRTLRSMGLRISLDDFGTGYSSLGYLKRLSLDELKIDQGFVRDILDDPNDAAIAETILALASALKLSAVAEGVETRGQLDRLVAMGCRHFQGYFFGRPVPASEFEQQVTKSASKRQKKSW